MILGGHGITAWGATLGGGRAELARDHPDRRAVHRRARPAGAASALSLPGTRPLPEPDRRGARRRALPVAARPGVHGPPAGRPLHRQRRRPRLRRPRGDARGSPRSGRHAPTTSCGRRSGRSSSTCPGRRRSKRLEARLRELHAAYRDEYRGLLRTARDARLAADARRRPGDRARAGRRHVQLRGGQADRPGRRRVLRQRDQRHARRRGNLAPTRRSRSRRSSASSTGRSRRPSWPGCPSRGRSRPASRS